MIDNFAKKQKKRGFFIENVKEKSKFVEDLTIKLKTI